MCGLFGWVGVAIFCLFSVVERLFALSLVENVVVDGVLVKRLLWTVKIIGHVMDSETLRWKVVGLYMCWEGCGLSSSDVIGTG